MERLIELEVALHQYQVRQCPDKVKQLLHPEFREVGESGNSYDFTTINNLMQSEQPTRGQLHSQDYEFVQIEPNVVLILYKTAWNDGLGHIGHFTKRSSLWVCSNGSWQMKYHQGTGCAPFKLGDNVTASWREHEPA